MSDLCMCFPHVTGRVPIKNVDEREVPGTPVFLCQTRTHSSSTIWRKFGAQHVFGSQTAL
jgi:hypothetical protein